ncbi:PREDICTED: beta-carotene 3-hydroxylase 1, chloroplastic-like isoform X1 [Tarenaya hassleriana]|uniref:beta-carotene 3-hydroxylase 1, chloroplastic-like isoform X1 n=1 Tax=Tarenaya hassleriana TaxID=28532 RepID=UPI00053C1773|nr:PREDICTED: beta-carotene 3-hydroxylase 1, chloroplastic-like isoform X1 [Tarenaya hassleriana]
MAAGLSVSVTIKPLLRSCSTSDFRRLHHHPISATVFAPLPRLRTSFAQRRSFAVCFVVEDQRQSSQIESPRDEGASPVDAELLASRLAEKLERKKSERFTYLVAAVMSSFGFTSMAVLAVYYRFSWQMEGGEVPMSEMFGTFALSVGAAVGMEFWARWAHRALWHASLWHMHESHHKAREGPFELNDVFAVINAVPAVGLFSYGFFNKGFVPGLCFGAGLGITVFGIAYMFVHDGLVHKRFPVGPIANVPYFRRVAAAHQLHHTDKFKGVPYGLFLGPKEVEEVGGKEELEKEISKRIKLCKKG